MSLKQELFPLVQPALFRAFRRDTDCYQTENEQQKTDQIMNRCFNKYPADILPCSDVTILLTKLGVGRGRDKAIAVLLSKS